MMEADKDGFLRCKRSLIQTWGRAARNVEGRVIMYADRVTDSMQACIDETLRRRAIQEAYNTEHDIIPQTVKKGLRSILESIEEKDYYTIPLAAEDEEEYRSARDIPRLVKSLRKEMLAAAKELDFEMAAQLRDRIRKLEDADLRLKGGPA